MVAGGEKDLICGKSILHFLAGPSWISCIPPKKSHFNLVLRNPTHSRNQENLRTAQIKGIHSGIPDLMLVRV